MRASVEPPVTSSSPTGGGVTVEPSEFGGSLSRVRGTESVEGGGKGEPIVLGGAEGRRGKERGGWGIRENREGAREGSTGERHEDRRGMSEGGVSVGVV